MSDRNRRMLLIGCVVFAAVLLAVIFGGDYISEFFRSDVDTTEGTTYVEETESSDMTSIEAKIQGLEDEAYEKSDDRSIREKFFGAVVMGDSVTEGFREYDILDASSVIATWGSKLDDNEDQVKILGEIRPDVIFLSYGLSDILSTNGDVNRFEKEYRTLISDIRKVLPDVKIFVNSIPPVKTSAEEEQPLYGNISDYNDALSQLCDTMQLTYMDNDSLAKENYYEEDGIHLTPDFYTRWANHMAEVASL